jgi:hypothetical protein
MYAAGGRGPVVRRAWPIVVTRMPLQESSLVPRCAVVRIPMSMDDLLCAKSFPGQSPDRSDRRDVWSGSGRALSLCPIGALPVSEHKGGSGLGGPTEPEHEPPTSSSILPTHFPPSRPSTSTHSRNVSVRASFSVLFANGHRKSSLISQPEPLRLRALLLYAPLGKPTTDSFIATFHWGCLITRVDNQLKKHLFNGGSR